MTLRTGTATMPGAVVLAAHLVLVVLSMSSTAWAQGAGPSAPSAERFAVLIGHNAGDSDEVSLRYAEDDARKVYEVLRDVGGFESANMTLSQGESADAVRRAVVSMNARVRASEGAILLVYYSGHADERQLHLGGDHLPTAELNDLVSGSAARFRVLVVDACRSGALTLRKGGVPDLPFALSAASPVGAEGFVVLTASSAGEDAQESELLRGSFFTHHLVSGLRGAADVDGDGDVSLEETYRHAFTNTVRQSSATLAGTQHPTYKYDVTGAGSLVLSRPRQGRRGAQVSFPADVSFLVFDDSAAGRVVAEVPAEATARTLSLEAGDYFVRGRARDVLYEGTIAVAPDGSRAVDLAALERIDYARLVRKGGNEVRSVSHEVRASYALRTSLHGAKDLCHGVRFGYAFVMRYATVDVTATGCGVGYQNRFVETLELEGGVDVGLSHSFDLPWVSLGVGGFAGLAGVHQHFETPGNAPDRLAASGTFGLRGTARVPLPAGVFVAVDLEGATYVFQRQVEDVVGVEAQLVGRGALGLGVQF